MGPPSTVKARETYSDPINLYVVCVAEPGVGKIQAICHHPQLDVGFVDRFAICSPKVRLLLEGRAGRME